MIECDSQCCSIVDFHTFCYNKTALRTFWNPIKEFCASMLNHSRENQNISKKQLFSPPLFIIYEFSLDSRNVQGFWGRSLRFSMSVSNLCFTERLKQTFIEIQRICLRRFHLNMIRSLEDAKQVWQQVVADKCLIPGVSSQGSVMQGIEPIIVGDGDVCTSLQQHRQHVISFLADSIVQGCVPLWILKAKPCVTSFLLLFNFNFLWKKISLVF